MSITRGAWVSSIKQDAYGSSGYPDKLSTASGTAPSYSVRAWVNFNGTGVVAIRESANVSSISDNGTGSYTLNFLTALPDGNFAASGTAIAGTTGSATVSIESATAYTGTPYQMNTTGLRIGCRNDAGILLDFSWITVAVFR